MTNREPFATRRYTLHAPAVEPRETEPTIIIEPASFLTQLFMIAGAAVSFFGFLYAVRNVL